MASCFSARCLAASRRSLASLPTPPLAPLVVCGLGGTLVEVLRDVAKILIAYDGSDCANAALEDLPRAGLPREAEVLIMSVADVFLPPSSSPAPPLPADVPVAVQRAWAQAAHAVDEARALAQHARTPLLTAFPTWDVCAEACADSPAWAVVKKADTWHPISLWSDHTAAPP